MFLISHSVCFIELETCSLPEIIMNLIRTYHKEVLGHVKINQGGFVEADINILQINNLGLESIYRLNSIGYIHTYYSIGSITSHTCKFGQDFYIKPIGIALATDFTINYFYVNTFILTIIEINLAVKDYLFRYFPLFIDVPLFDDENIQSIFDRNVN